MFKGLALLAAGEVGGAVKRKLTAYVLFAIAGLIALAGLGYLLGALHIWLSVNYSPIQASLFIAGGLFVVALAFAIAGAIVARRKASNAQALQTAAAVAAAPLALRAASKINPTALVALGVVAVGAILGRKLGK